MTNGERLITSPQFGGIPFFPSPFPTCLHTQIPNEETSYPRAGKRDRADLENRWISAFAEMTNAERSGLRSPARGAITFPCRHSPGRGNPATLKYDSKELAIEFYIHLGLNTRANCRLIKGREAKFNESVSVPAQVMATADGDICRIFLEQVGTVE